MSRILDVVKPWSQMDSVFLMRRTSDLLEDLRCRVFSPRTVAQQQRLGCRKSGIGFGFGSKAPSAKGLLLDRRSKVVPGWSPGRPSHQPGSWVPPTYEAQHLKIPARPANLMCHILCGWRWQSVPWIFPVCAGRFHQRNKSVHSYRGNNQRSFISSLVNLRPPTRIRLPSCSMCCT